MPSVASSDWFAVFSLASQSVDKVIKRNGRQREYYKRLVSNERVPLLVVSSNDLKI